MKQVIGVAFIKDGKLLTVQSVRSSKTNSYTFVGGGVEVGETLKQAAIREIHEEISFDFNISEDNLHPILCFREGAASDPNLEIEMTVFLSDKEIDVPLVTNSEILDFYWLDVKNIDKEFSSSIIYNFIPYALDEKILY